MVIRGSVHLVHLVPVIIMPLVLELHLTCVPVTRPAATGVNAIKDLRAMDWIAHEVYRGYCSKKNFDITRIESYVYTIVYWALSVQRSCSIFAIMQFSPFFGCICVTVCSIG